MPVRAGPTTIAAAFIKKHHAPVEDVLQPFQFSMFEPAVDGDPDWTFVPHLASMAVSGPFNITGAGNTPARQRIFVCRPANPSDERACATQIV